MIGQRRVTCGVMAALVLMTGAVSAQSVNDFKNAAEKSGDRYSAATYLPYMPSMSAPLLMPACT